MSNRQPADPTRSAFPRKAFAARSIAAIAISAMALSPLAQAASLAQAQQDCRDRVDAHNDNVNSIAADRVLNQRDDFPRQVAHAPVPTSQSGGSGGNFSCYDLTQDAFKDVLTDAGSLFGDYGSLFTSIFGGMASSGSSSLCGEAQQAVGNLFQKVTVKCPNTSVPGMPTSCSGSLGMSTGGVTYSGSGTLGGASGSTGGTFGGGVVNAKAPASGSLVNKFSCWLSNSCGN